MGDKNLSKIDFLDIVKASCLRHRGDVAEIVTDLSVAYPNITSDLVRKCIRKIKREEEEDTKVRVANVIAGHIFLGYKSRYQLLMDLHKFLRAKESTYISLCCASPVKKCENDPYRYECLSCGQIKPANTDTVRLVNTIKGLLTEMRQEDIEIREFASKFGYIAKEEAPTPIQNYKPNILVINDKNGEHKLLQDSLQNMSGMERESLVKKLDQQLVDIEAEIIGRGKTDDGKDSSTLRTDKNIS